jgi:hypothetical protein
MNDLKERISEEIEKAILSQIRDSSFIRFDRTWNSKVSSSMLDDAWEMVDHHKIKTEMAKILEQTIAEKVINLMASEIATDMKLILSNKDRREEIRHVARTHLKHMIKDS